MLWNADGNRIRADDIQEIVSVPIFPTQNNYNCCNLLWTKDEDGRYIHYTYDAANRVTDTWLDNTTGESVPGTPLAHYTYDSFGNVYEVTTFSDSSTGRTTTYTYDDDNRVVQIDHPVGLGSEYFEYDNLGNMVGTKDGLPQWNVCGNIMVKKPVLEKGGITSATVEIAVEDCESEGSY
jgi:YD repeat-containing protein